MRVPGLNPGTPEVATHGGEDEAKEGHRLQMAGQMSQKQCVERGRHPLSDTQIEMNN